ncbi:hypothetical protein GCM10022278_19500 [Allohahella marinimesophila]|uniref:Uncharacterized protein n=1 Tax=Allohahella marinimesophila TaxID=1054972 RepID=A0ABP7P8R3_9GAMM
MFNAGGANLKVVGLFGFNQGHYAIEGVLIDRIYLTFWTRAKELTANNLELAKTVSTGAAILKMHMQQHGERKRTPARAVFQQQVNVRMVTDHEKPRLKMKQ